MATLDNYYEMLLSGTIKTIARVELLRKDESVYEQITGDLIDGSLTINKQNGVRRSVSLTLRNRDKRYLPNVDGLWVGTKFRLLLGYDFGDNDYYFINQGIFIIANPSITSNGAVNTISLNGVDKFALYDGQYCGTLNDNVQVANGTNVNTAIKNIISDVGIMGIGNLDPQPVNFDPFNVNLSYTLRKDMGDTVSSAINELAFYSSRNLYYNSDGLLTFEEDFDDTTKGSIWNFNGVNSYQKDGTTISTLDTKTYQGMTKTPHLGEVYNVIKVIGTSIDGSSAVAIAKNTNPLSDTNINTIGERFAKPIDDTRITTASLAQKRADFELKKLIRLNATLNISSLPMYHLDVDEVITVTDTNTNDISERYVIQSINITFGSNALMSITATNVKELALEVTV